MKTDEFDFVLPERLIAQHPYQKRDHARLLVLNRKNNKFEHKMFYEIINYLKKGDVLVLNDTKVLPARLIGYKAITQAKIEILLLKELEKDTWECLVKPSKKIEVGTEVLFSNILKATCIKKLDDGICHFNLTYQGILIEILEKLGQMPLPPYIKTQVSNNDDYQTVYASNLGSAAAPTAGFHFTDDLLAKIEEIGVEILKITLHVGLGTFRPVTALEINQHEMHYENYTISNKVSERLNQAVKDKKRIIAVGTTTVRTLESNFDNGFKAGNFDTNIFIYPGYKFKVVDALITNFHLPKSTLIMLVSAFYDKNHILQAYKAAIDENYLFFSFGDAMFIY